jgi:CopA family copper-resistance protein
MTDTFTLSRGRFIQTLGAGLFAAAMPRPAWARSGWAVDNGPRQRYDLSIDYMPMVLNGRAEPIRATAINGTVPAPLVHLREGDEVELNVTNRLMDTKHSSIHWHGILVPFEMDGVPGVNFRGIPPGETYNYRYRLKQAGTYWYHSHSFFQEQTGMYGPLIIEPKDGEPFQTDRDYTVMLSDWTSAGPREVFRNLTMSEGYYNYQQRTLKDLIADFRRKGFSATAAERYAWGKMRMSSVDLAAITGAEYTYLQTS